MVIVRSSRGFTLLEVIVALAIMGISIAVTMHIFSGGLKNIYRIDMAHRAMHHAENVMNEILADQDIRGPLQLADDLDEEFDYLAEIDYWEDPDQGMLLKQEQQLPVYLLSVRVDVFFKNDSYGKLYRTACLKTVPNETTAPGQNPSDVNRSLFGGGNR